MGNCMWQVVWVVPKVDLQNWKWLRKWRKLLEQYWEMCHYSEDGGKLDILHCVIEWSPSRPLISQVVVKSTIVLIDGGAATFSGELNPNTPPSTLKFILHAFLHPVIFSQHMPIPMQSVLLQYQCMSSTPSLSLSSLLGSLSFSLTPHIHLTILISARWRATTFFSLQARSHFHATCCFVQSYSTTFLS